MAVALDRSFTSRNAFIVAHAVLAALLVVGRLVLIPVPLQMLGYTGSIVYVGAHRSLSMFDKDSETGEALRVETLSRRDAALVPALCLVLVVSLYATHKCFGANRVYVLLTVFFSGLVLAALAESIRLLVAPLLPEKVSRQTLHLKMPRLRRLVCRLVPSYAPEGDEDAWALHCGRLVHIPIAVLISLVYLKTEDQTLHNIFAACFALQVLTLVSLGRFAIGIVLLGGLALYDAFRISGALAAVTSEAGSLGLVQVILPMSWDPRRQLTIGIGNIAVPGVFVAMCLRFDAQSHLRSGREAVNAFVDFPKPCFWSTFCACSLAVLISGCSVAEPALLHLVPGTLIIFVGMCYVRGQLGEMWAYNEEDLLPSKDAKSDKQR